MGSGHLTEGRGFLKGDSQLWDRADLDTSFLTLKSRSSPQPEIKVYLEFRFDLRSVLFDFQSLTEKPRDYDDSLLY